MWCYRYNVLMLYDHSMRLERQINHTDDVIDVNGLCASEDRVYVAGLRGLICAISREGLQSLGSNGWGMCTAMNHYLAGYRSSDDARKRPIADPALSRDGRALYAIQFEIPPEAPRGLNQS